MTYEQVERELSNYNAHENDLAAVFSALSLYTKPDESDYALYENGRKNWAFPARLSLRPPNISAGEICLDSICFFANFPNGESSRRGNPERSGRTGDARVDYFQNRPETGRQDQQSRPLHRRIHRKWYNYGYDETALSEIAMFCLRTERNEFSAMDELIQQLFSEGIVSADRVGEYLKVRNDELRLFTRIQSYCGNLRKTPANLSLVGTWRSWNFSDRMILEAARRSSGSANPIPYMNKILSDWKHDGIFEPAKIPEKAADSSKVAAGYSNANAAAVEAVNAKTDRERYYALLREHAQSVADKYTAKANADPRFKEISRELSRMEIKLAKAEVFEPDSLPSLLRNKEKLLRERGERLRALGITEEQLTPQYRCKNARIRDFFPTVQPVTAIGQTEQMARTAPKASKVMPDEIPVWR